MTSGFKRMKSCQDVPPFLGTTLSIAIVEIGTIIDAIITPTSARVISSIISPR